MPTSSGSETQTDNTPSDERAEHFLSLARDTGKRLSSASLVWSFALLVSFVAVNTELSKRIEEITKSTAAHRNLKNQQDKTREVLTNLIAKAGASTGTQKEAAQADVAKAEDKLALIAQKIDNEKKNVQSSLHNQLSVSLPGLSSISINPPLAPALWILLALIVVLHLSSLREKSHGYLLLALKDMPQRNRQIPIAAPPAALLAPMPANGPVSDAAEDYLAAYGDPSTLRISRLPTVVLMLCIVCAQFWMLWVQSTLQPFFVLTQLKLVTQIASMFCISATITACCFWLLPWSIPNDEALPQGKLVRQRRQFLRLLIGATVITCATGLIVKKTPFVRIVRKALRPVFALMRWRPRFRRKVRAEGIFVDLPPGLALNKTSGVVHVVVNTPPFRVVVDEGADGRPQRRIERVARRRQLLDLNASEKIRSARFTHVKDPLPFFDAKDTNDATDLRRSTVPRAFDEVIGFNGWTFEQIQKAVMTTLREDLAFRINAGLKNRGGNKQRASRNARDASHLPAVDMRLYDRFAGFAARAGRRDAIDTLVDFMRENGLDNAFASRVQKWQDTNSKWSRKQVTEPAERVQRGKRTYPRLSDVR